MAQPRGLEGHEGLFLAHESRAGAPRGHLFKCARCQALWARNYAGDGVFQWLEVRDDGGHRQ